MTISTSSPKKNWKIYRQKNILIQLLADISLESIKPTHLIDLFNYLGHFSTHEILTIIISS